MGYTCKKNQLTHCHAGTLRYLGNEGHWGDSSQQRPWEDGSYTLDNHKRRLLAAYELLQKLGIKYYSLSDMDLWGPCDSWEESQRCSEEMVTLAAELQRQTQVKPLFFSADLFSHPRYAQGAAASPDAHVFAFAAAQVKRAMDAAKRLGAENFVFFNPRDGYSSGVWRSLFRDVSHMAQLYRMAAHYRDKIGFRGQLLIQPRGAALGARAPYEPDAHATMFMLRHFGLEKHYKLYVKPASSRPQGRPFEHDVCVAAAYNMLGAVDAAEAWTDAAMDVAPYDVRDATIVMKSFLDQVTFALRAANVT